MGDWSIDISDQAEPMISFRYSGKVTNYTRSYGNTTMIAIPGISIPNLEKPAERKYPVSIDFPENRIDSVFCVVPDNLLELTSIPDCDTIVSAYGAYHLRAEKVSDGVVIIRHFKLNSGQYALDEYPEFYAFIKRIKKREKKIALIIDEN